MNFLHSRLKVDILSKDFTLLQAKELEGERRMHGLREDLVAPYLRAVKHAVRATFLKAF